MYLDKIEIHGFKSFGDAVKLNIPKGITAVIGPNGSGKSNVSDAIRWVLGEQSAKSLRGSKMEDIIFAGTEKRKSLGYAEVALTIKNPDDKVPIAYTEIVVKRRVYRSGESEYFINGSTCRLKDVQELFMDTGIGKDGYSIIGQGQIDRVLSSKPEERRSLFEEAAGIYKYKVRRIEAERKLEKERENLVRIQDIIVEITSRLEPLEIEAEKTERFLKLKEKLKTIDLNVFIYDMERIEKELEALLEQIKAVEDEIQNNIALQEECRNKSTACKEKKDYLYRTVEQLIGKLSELEKEKEKKHSQITLNEEKISHIETLLQKVHEDRNAEKKDQKNKIEKFSLLETKKVALEIEKASKKDILLREENKLAEMIQNLSELEGNIDSSKEELYQKTREIDLYEAEIKKNDSVEEQLEYRQEQIKEQVALLNSEIQHQEVSLKLAQKHQNESEDKMIVLKKHIEVNAAQNEQLRQDKLASERSLNQAEQSYVQTERQLKWLKQLKDEHEGYFGSVKQVLKVAKENSMAWKGIIGVVGELLDVPKIYETAIVTALGGAIQNIVTETEEDAKNMIKVMKQRGISRVTFLPKDTVRPSGPIKENRLKDEEGFLGFGNEVVKYDTAYTNIVSSLLGRILIIKDMQAASRIARKYNYKYKLVTLEGEVFNSGGSLSGGSTKTQTQNIFSRTREMKELEEKSIALKQEVSEKKKALEQFNLQLETQLKAYEAFKNELQSIEDKKREYVLDYEKNEHALKLTKNNQLQLITERSNIEESLNKIKAGKEDIKEKLKTLKISISKDETALVDLETKLNTLKQEREKFNEALTEKRISLSQTEQNLNYLMDQICELQNLIAHFDEKSEHYAEMIASYKNEKEELSKQNEHLKQEIAVHEEAIKEGQQERMAYDQTKLDLEKEETQVSEKMLQISDVIEHLKEEKYRLESKKESSLSQKQTWGNNMWEQYEITYTKALAYKEEAISIADYKKQALQIRSEIKQIGSVNVNAIEEFKETKQRYAFLVAQKEDIEKAEQMLLEMIESLTEQMKEIFKQQFEKIAENFTHVFKELFGGGEAYLQLLDEENILDSGIEIIAKPPGKKLQNMNLLSGGERTLTAISLVFGILKLKPSPFCILDEIEAALDDANVLRFANYLETLSGETQFIVITHRKGTMERAHTLYGVTMQERGVSTILSIQLEDAQKYIDNKKTS